MTKTTAGTLNEGEFHPSAPSAFEYVKSRLDPLTLEAYASTALSGHRQAEICYETMRRVIEGKPVSDRYILGLAWHLKQVEEVTSHPAR